MRTGTGRTARLALCVALPVAAVAAPLVGGRPAWAQTDQYDGVYVGLQTLAEAPPPENYSKCLRGPFKRKLVVKAGTVTYVYNPTYQGTVIGTVAADGRVAAEASTSSGGVSLIGKIAGDDFTGEVWSIICTYSVQLKRTPQKSE